MKNIKDLLLEEEMMNGVEEVVWKSDIFKIVDNIDEHNFCIYVNGNKIDDTFLSVEDAMNYLIKNHDVKLKNKVFTYWKHY